MIHPWPGKIIPFAFKSPAEGRIQFNDLIILRQCLIKSAGKGISICKVAIIRAEKADQAISLFHFFYRFFKITFGDQKPAMHLVDQ